MLLRVLHLYRDAYAGLSRPVWLLAVVALIHRSGTMVEPFLVLYLTQELGYSAGVAGGFLALIGLGSLIGSYVGGAWTERWGARAVQAAALGLAGGFLIALGRVENPWILAALLLGFSITNNAFRPANAVAITAWVEPERRTQSFGLLRLAINVGMTFGPAIGGFLALVDYELLFWVDGITCLLAVMFLLTRVPRSRDDAADSPSRSEGDERETAPSPWRDGYFLRFLALVTVTGMVVMQLVGTFPLTLREIYGLSEDRIGLLFAVNTVWIVAVEMVLLHKLSRFSDLKVLSLGALLVGLGFGLMPFGRGFAFAALSVTVWTFGEMLTFPVATAVAANRSGRGHPGRHLGALTATLGLSYMGAQIVGPWIYQLYGPQILWLGCAVVGALAAAGFRLLAIRWRPGL